MSKQMDELTRQVEERNAEAVKVHAFSQSTLTKLKAHDDTDMQAKFLANICVQLDERFGSSSLTLEWMVGHYLGMDYHNNVAPQLEALHDKLVDGKHTHVNQWDHFKGYAYYIPCKAKDEWSSKKVLVMTNENNDGWQWLVIMDENSISKNVYVRKIWKKTRLNCIGSVDQPTLRFYRKIRFDLQHYNHSNLGVYGDSRDFGHIMSYKSSKDIDFDANTSTNVAGKCKHSLSFASDNLRWFMEVSFLHTEMEQGNV